MLAGTVTEQSQPEINWGDMKPSQVLSQTNNDKLKQQPTADNQQDRTMGCAQIVELGSSGEGRGQQLQQQTENSGG